MSGFFSYPSRHNFKTSLIKKEGREAEVVCPEGFEYCDREDATHCTYGYKACWEHLKSHPGAGRGYTDVIYIRPRKTKPDTVQSVPEEEEI